MKLCGKKEAQNLDELNSRIDELENRVKKMETEGIIHKKSQNVEKEPATKGQNVENSPKSNNVKQAKNIVSGIPGKKIEEWPNIVNSFKQNGKIMLYTNLMNSTAKEINDMTVGIEFPNGLTSFGKTVLEKPENINELTKLLSIQCGKEMRVKLIDKTNINQFISKEDELVNEMKEAIDMPINIIEE